MAKKKTKKIKEKKVKLVNQRKLLEKK